MKEFEFSDLDEEGKSTLEVIAEADNFNKWMYDTIRPNCTGQILEIGSGTGNISKYFLKSEADITLSDIRKNYCEYLKRSFEQYTTLRDVLLMDLIDKDFEKIFKQHAHSYDTIFALNVVEHINEDNLAIKNCKYLLKLGGTLIILVPANQFLYNSFDKALGHYRRYNKSTLQSLFLQNGFTIIQKEYFNIFGTLGWYVSGKLQKNAVIPKGQMEIFNKLVFVIKYIDKLFLKSFGLSVIVVGKINKE
jgi:2-polyprenyl-3-methyl-5-hydroxy-6-metoxy-1,4-benzoquinol methylase